MVEISLFAAVNGSWSAWGSWDACTVTCGGGTQTRTRSCTDPIPEHGGLNCTGSAEESAACGTVTCPLPGETQSQLPHPDTITILYALVNGAWSAWSIPSACSVTCGTGPGTRTRTCDNPPPSNGGSTCVGAGSEPATCSLSPCPSKKQLKYPRLTI